MTTPKSLSASTESWKKGKKLEISPQKARWRLTKPKDTWSLRKVRIQVSSQVRVRKKETKSKSTTKINVTLPSKKEKWGVENKEKSSSLKAGEYKVSSSLPSCLDQQLLNLFQALSIRFRTLNFWWCRSSNCRTSSQLTTCSQRQTSCRESSPETLTMHAVQCLVLGPNKHSCLSLGGVANKFHTYSPCMISSNTQTPSFTARKSYTKR